MVITELSIPWREFFKIGDIVITYFKVLKAL